MAALTPKWIVVYDHLCAVGRNFHTQGSSTKVLTKHVDAHTRPTSSSPITTTPTTRWMTVSRTMFGRFVGKNVFTIQFYACGEMETLFHFHTFSKHFFFFWMTTCYRSFSSATWWLPHRSLRKSNPQLFHKEGYAPEWIEYIQNPWCSLEKALVGSKTCY